MTGQRLIQGLLFIAVTATAFTAQAQNSDESPSLVDRLNSFRRGWSVRQKDQPTPAERTNVRTADSRGATPRVLQNGRRSSELPRVNSRDLLPRDMSSARRRRTPVSQKTPEPSPREPRTASRPPVGLAPLGSKNAPSLGDAYLDNTAGNENKDNTAKGGPAAGFGSFEDLAATEETAAEESAKSQLASRPSPSVRRSPKSGPRYDFDPEELSRDLVDSTGKSAADNVEPEIAEPELAKSEPQAETAALPENAPRVAQLSPQTDELESPIPLPLAAAKDELAEQIEPLPEAPLAEAQTDSFAENEVANPIDQERVKIAGERAFAEGPSPLPLAAESFGSSGLNSEPQTQAGAFPQQQQFSQHRSFLNGENVLSSTSMPVISSHVSGPKNILIGRESNFRVHLSNRGDVAAQEVVAQIQIPVWADVVDTVATTGIIQRSQDTREPNTYRWQLHRLGAQHHETLDLKLIPRSSRPLELGVNCTFAQAASQAVVEVLEPKLRMSVSGPDEVLYNKAQLYRLTLTNPGTGLAEGVVISLLPPGGGEQAVSTHEIGELAPGTSKSVEVELTAREPGKLFVKASAEALGGLTAESQKDIFCRKPELEIDWRGPDQKYSGTVGTYYFRVRNPGTAAAENVAVNIRLPKGVEFLNASDGQMFDPDQNEVRWRVGSLRPGDDYYMELKCTMNLAGLNSFDIEATTADIELSDREVAETQVIALADLKLDVLDPKGPIPVGEEAIYEIRVRNRGNNTAEQVNIVALFSDGIDAQSVEGAQYTVTDGRVTFRTIEKLAADREVVLRIRAQATRPGTHVFRAEVRCRDLEIKLAAEESTRFFEDESFGSSTDGPEQSAGRPNPFGESAGSRY